MKWIVANYRELYHIIMSELDVVNTHILKTDSVPFQALIDKKKLAEFRKNDRQFAEGDILFLHEHKESHSTGRVIKAKITHIQSGYGIPLNYRMLSIEIEAVFNDFNRPV